MKTNPKTLCSKILKRECPVELPLRKAPRYFVIFSSLIWSLIDVSKPFYKKVTWKLDQNDVEIICDYNRSKIIIMTPYPPAPPGPRPLPTQNFPYGLGAIILLKYQKYKTCVVSNSCDELWQNINYFIFILFYITYYFNYLLLYIF